MTQSALAAALLNPDAALPGGLIDPLGRPATRRFNVYRNNVAAGLTRALEAGFPVVRRLVGDEFFGAMAAIHLRAHPPRRPILMLYGADFPDFPAGFPPVMHLGYLPCMARLELAMRHSYHAGDATPLPPEALGLHLMTARLHLAPSLRLLRSVWPIWSIWQANTTGGATPQMRPEDVVLLRPGFDPKPHLIPPATADFLAALLQNRTLGEAIHSAGPQFDLTEASKLLVANHAITGIAS